MNEQTPSQSNEGRRGRRLEAPWPTLPELFRATVERFPDRRCFTSFEPVELTMTYAEAMRRVGAVAAELRRRGLGVGDRAVVTGKNSPEWAIAYLGVLFAGATVVPLDYAMEEEQLRSLSGFAEVSAAFVDAEKRSTFEDRGLRLEALYSLAPDHPGYVLDLPVDDPAQEPPGPAVREEDLAAILFTSGTTGTPKGVMLSHRNLVSDCVLGQELMELTHQDVFYALLPLHHAYTMLAVLLESISVGAEVVFGKRLAITQILADLKKGRVTMFLGVPALFNRIIKGINRKVRERGLPTYLMVRALMGASGLIKKSLGVNPGKKVFHSLLSAAALDKIRICISGGGPLPASTFRRFNQLGIDFVQGYGLTETSPIVTLNPKDHYKEDSVGRVLPQVHVTIADPDSEGNGEILVKGPIVMQGYYRNPEATSEVLLDDGTLKTGDVGHLDREGYLYLTGRKKSLIVTEGGKNVFPEELEESFQLFDEIEQILVRGYLKDERMKVEGIEALIFPSHESLQAEGVSDPQQIRERIARRVSEVNARLPMYKRIQRFEVLSEPMETTSTRKIKRHRV